MDLKEAIASQNEVSLILAKHLLPAAAKSPNSVFSPLSLNLLLSLIAAGSGGATQAQILSFLKSKSIAGLNILASQIVAGVLTDGSASGGPRVSFTSGAWVDSSLSIKPSFKKVADDVYKTVSKEVDFQNQADQVCKVVNSWAEKETNGLIKDILPPGSIDSSTRLILGNALYFKGEWVEKFDSPKTKEHDFHLLDGSKIKAPFMTSRSEQYISEYFFKGFKVLRLPYKQGGDKNRRFSMYFYLPDAKDGLPALMEKFCSEPGFLDRYVPKTKVEVDSFLLPKFKISFGFEASKTLQKLGLVLPFSAGMSEMASGNLSLSSIFHKAFVEINEEGTEAAAVTVATCGVTSLDSAPMRLSFVADHPFLFVIKEDLSGVVQFIGTVVDPTLS